ncbi:hypothetical protein Tco_0856033 [Tanacetum coccineum]
MKTKRKLVPISIGSVGPGNLGNNQNEGARCIPLDTDVIVPVQQSFAEDVSGSKRKCIRNPKYVSSSNVPLESLNGSGQCVPLNTCLNVAGQQTLPPDVGGSKRKCSHGLGNLNEDGQNVEAQQPLASDVGGSKQKCSHGLGNLDEDGQCLPLDRDVNIFGRQIPVEDVGGSKRRCVRQLHGIEMLEGDGQQLGVPSSVNEISSDMNVDAPDVQISLVAQQPATNNSLGVSDSVSHSSVPLSAPRGFTEGTFQADNHTASSTFPSNYKSVGRCEHSCEYCGALFWYEERLKSVGTNRRPKYGRCYKGSQVVRLYNVVRAREYELPTSDMLGSIVYEPGLETDMDYDIIIEEHSGHLQRVNKLHSSYMSLQFPLLFSYGKDVYSKDLKLVCGTGTSTIDRRLSMKAYYAYFIHDPVNCYNYLSRTGRLFQQYIVTAFCAIEQNRIDYVREHQNDIRNEYLSGIYDPIN